MTKTKTERPKIMMTEMMLIVIGCAGVLALACLCSTLITGGVHDHNASAAVGVIASAQANAHDATGQYLGGADLVDQGFLTADDAKAVSGLKVRVGNDGYCFVATAPVAGGRTVYATSRLTDVKMASGAPKTGWCVTS